MSRLLLVLAVLSCLLVPSGSAFGFGLVLSGIGSVNRSMGGAAVAAPIDVTGALHWNPAAIAGLEGSQMDFGVEILELPSTLSSTIPADALGPGVPPVPLSGSTDVESGNFALPSAAFVTHAEGAGLSYGIGVFTIGGFGVNYPGSATNPILTPPAPAGLGLGNVYSRLTVLQVAPTLAWRAHERIAIGVAPTVTIAELTANPATVAPPDDANGDSFPTYPNGTQSKFHWGGGVQLGVYVELDGGLRLGASWKSKQSFEQFEWNSADEIGAPRRLTFDFEYPMIVSAGLGYVGVERLTLAGDLRWIDYEGAKGFEPAGYRADGAVTGLGWKSVWALSLGAQYELTPDWRVRGGYSYGENPIADDVAMFNVASPSITDHIVYGGLTWRVAPAWALSGTALHAFENSVRGPVVSPLGEVPGTAVQTDLSVTGFSFGLTAYL